MNKVETKHFVTFFSPGTFMAETTTKPIGEWDPRVAVRMATDVKERYGAIPYGFRFETRACAPDSSDGQWGIIAGAQKKVAESPMHFICGKIETLAQVEARNDPSENILLSNMRYNKYPAVISATKGWRWTQPFMPGDINLDTDGNVLEKQQ